MRLLQRVGRATVIVELSSDIRKKGVTLLADFAKNVIARKSAEFDALMERGDERLQPEIEAMPSPESFFGPAGEKLLKAYETLRLLRQRQFSDYKLRDDGRLFSKFPRTQAKVLGWVGIGCILAILFLDVFAAAKAIFHANANKAETGSISNLSHQLAIWIALLALAIRAIEEGLKPRAEIERYRHYQAVTERLLERYSHSAKATKIEIMRTMEHAAYDEMVIFLRSYHESRFVM
jgi:hypothetical protein